MIGKFIHGNGSMPVSQARLLLSILLQISANRAGSSSLKSFAMGIHGVC